MRGVEAQQLGFELGQNNIWAAPIPVGEPVAPEREYRVESLITLSGIEKIIYRDIEGVKPSGIIDSSAAVGIAIDNFLVPANFIYRYRSDYCFPEGIYADWDLRNVFARFYPTGWGYQEMIDLLEKHRPNFWDQFNPLNPRHSNLERGNIKERLIPLWREIAKNLQLDRLRLQRAMTTRDQHLVVSNQPALAETVAEIGQRIVRDRFDALVDDDQNYTYIAKPDCLLVYEIGDQTTHIQVQPDYIKRLREKRRSVRKRQIVARRIVGDFKDSENKDLGDFSTPFGKTMLVYNWLLTQIAERFKLNQLKWVKLANRQKRKVFLIPQEVSRPIPPNLMQIALEFLREDGREIFSPMPMLSEEEHKLAQSIFEKALWISKQSKI